MVNAHHIEANNCEFIALRKQAGFPKQEALARALKIDRTTVGKWETGDSVPKLKMLPKLAKALGVSIETIVTVFSGPAG